MIKEPSERLGHIPKADDLYMVRDMLYIILRNSPITREELYSEIKCEFSRSGVNIWATATFDEYLSFINYLEFIESFESKKQTDERVIKLRNDVQDFLKNNVWTKEPFLSEKEKSFFRKKLFRYRAVVRFLEVVFCDVSILEPEIDTVVIKKIVALAKPVKGRKTLLDKWMVYCNVTDDRDSRAILTWCIQTDIVNRDEHSDMYFVVSDKKPTMTDFKLSLVRNYPLVFDRDLKRARIPDIRVRVCEDLHLPLMSFDKLLESFKT